MSNVLIPIHQTARLVPPTDLACLIAGTSKVSYPGFGDAPQQLSPWQQVITIVDPGLSESGIIVELRKQGARSRRMLATCFFGLALVIVLAAATIWFLDHRDIPLAPIEWSIGSIHDRSVEISTGSTRIQIPVGAKFPNGDVLLSTSPTTSSFTTSAGTTRLGKQL